MRRKNKPQPEFATFSLSLAALLIGVLLSGALFAQARTPVMVPRPQQATFFDAAFQVTPDTRLLYQTDLNADDRATVDYLNDKMEERLGFRLVTNAWDGTGGGIYLGRLKPDLPDAIAEDLDIAAVTRIGEQGYYLLATESRVVLLANSSAGLFYGVLSLLQLIEPVEQGHLIPGVTIYDWPTFDLRGVWETLDHGPLPNQEHFKEIVEVLSEFKINTLFLNLTHRFDFKNHPKLSVGRATLSGSEIRDLEAFARRRHIRLVPVLETLSHWADVLLLPEYRNLGEFPGSTSLAPLRTETYEFLDDLIFEITESFDSPYLHIGVGAPHQVGWRASQVQVGELGLVEVLAEHFRRVIGLVRKYDKQVILDGDLLSLHPELAQRLPEDILFTASGDHPLPEFVAERCLISANLWAEGALFPDYYRTIPAIIRAGRRAQRANGLIVAHKIAGPQPAFHDFERYGWAVAADCAWSPDRLASDDFEDAIARRVFGADYPKWSLLHGLMADVTNLANWSDLRRHPLFIDAVPDANLYERSFRLRFKATQARLLLESLRTDDQADGDLDYYGWLADLGATLAKTVDAARSVEEVRSVGSFSRSSGQTDAITGRSYDLVENLNELIEKLQLVWIRKYRTEDMSDVISQLSAQIDYWQEIINQIQNGEIVKEPRLTSQWIYHPELRKSEGALSTEHAFFRKTFEVLPGFKKAYLQAIADSHIKVYLNGGFLDEVIAPMARPEISSQHGVEIWDITTVLEAGKNVLAVEAWSYAKDAPAGFNLRGQIEYEFGRRLVVESDPYWKASLQEEPNWQKLGYFDVQWLNAEPRPKALVFSKPNFELGRPSQLQHGPQ